LERKKIAIIGGGITGLAAGMELVRNGYDVDIYEKEDSIGGLASGKIINDNIYEYGPHFFHTNNPRILSEIKEIAGDELIDFERTILIKFMDDYFTYPLSIFEVLKKLPKKIVLSAMFHLIVSNIRGLFVKPEVENSETVLLRYYGKVLYELFFKSYIYHVWGLYPDKFSPEFAMERIPRISGSLFINKLISPIRARLSRKSTKHFVENVDGQLYTTRYGYRGIINKMADNIVKNGGNIHLDTEVVKIGIESGLVKNITVKKDGRESDIGFDGLINTIPINNAISIIDPGVDGELKESVKKLEFRALVFVGVLVDKPKVLPVSFMYFREHSFNRIYDSSYFSHDTILPDTTILVAEISSGTKDRWWTDDDYCRKKVLEDLLRENIIEKRDVLEANVYRYEFGYPVYRLGYERHLNRLFEFIQNINNMETAGRQGRFQYINGHIAIQMGFKAARKMISSTGSGP